jgi:hypothetical protein
VGGCCWIDEMGGTPGVVLLVGLVLGGGGGRADMC